jgi:hypothetical protein
MGRVNISIFTRPAFIAEDPGTYTGPYMHRGTSYIRGEQMAEFLGGKHNPTSGYENDILIYLKPRKLDHIKDGSYVDFSDTEPYLIGLLQNRPKLKVITSNLTSFEFLKGKLKNALFLIPEHHCNFERTTRTRKEFTTGGIITNPSAASYQAYNQVKKKLSEIGLKFITCYDWKNRQDVVDFYKLIDFQIISMFGIFNDYDPFRHPTKIINAASYGIPTVANWKHGYKEFEGNYIPVHTIDDLIRETEKLKNKNYYDKLVKKIIKAAEPYHIENVAKLYRELT